MLQAIKKREALDTSVQGFIQNRCLGCSSAFRAAVEKASLNESRRQPRVLSAKSVDNRLFTACEQLKGRADAGRDLRERAVMADRRRLFKRSVGRQPTTDVVKAQDRFEHKVTGRVDT